MLIILVLVSLSLSKSTWGVTCERAQGASAIDACRQALQKRPQDVDILIQYTDILLDLGRSREAVDLLEASHGKKPTNSTIRLKLSEAREAAVKPARDTGPSSRAIQKLTELRCTTRTGQAALESCNAALSNQPNDIDLLTAKGNALMLLKRPREAVDAYRLAFAQDKSNSAIQNKLKLAIAETPKPKPKPKEDQPVPVVVSSPAPLQVARKSPPPTDEPKIRDPETVEAKKEIVQVVRFSNAPIDGRISY